MLVLMLELTLHFTHLCLAILPCAFMETQSHTTDYNSRLQLDWPTHGAQGREEGWKKISGLIVKGKFDFL